MSLKFLTETNAGKLKKVVADLAVVDPSFKLVEYQNKTVNRLSGDLKNLRESIRNRKTGVYGSWLKDESYIRDMLVVEAISSIIDYKQDKMDRERLIPAMPYYRNTARFNNTLVGERCVYLGENVSWVPYKEDARDAKIFTVLRYGSEAQFKKLYVEMANGRIDGLTNICLEHITQSTNGSKRIMEKYCDSQWTGAWPWEVSAPEKLNLMIESREDKKMIRIVEMQRKLTKILREFDEGNMSQFELVNAAQDMVTTVDNTISSLGKLASSGIEVMAQAKVAGSTDTDTLQNALGEPLNTAVAALTDLKAALSNAVEGITGGNSPTIDIDVEDDLGTVGDAMGDNPADPSDVDVMADVDIGGDEERAMKEI